MATLQELMDEATADVLRKHGVPRDLRKALKRSAGPAPKRPAKSKAPHRSRKTAPNRSSGASRPKTGHFPSKFSALGSIREC
jgi:hypothetical protein